MVRSIVIPRNENSSPRILELVSIDEFQEVVGGWLEPIPIEALGVTVYANETMRELHGSINSRATALSWYFSSGADLRKIILGDVALTGIDDGLIGADVPEEVIHMLFELHRFVVQGSPDRVGTWCDTFARFDNIFDAALWCMLLGSVARPHSAFRIQVEASDGVSARSHLLGGERSW